MNILYLHGLDSKITESRKSFLEKQVQVQAPILDYRKEPEQLFSNLLKEYASVDAIVGISAGGLVGAYMAQQLQIPCLLFNPALPFRKGTHLDVPLNRSNKQYMQVVVGQKDTIVNPIQTLEILGNELKGLPNVVIHQHSDLEHLIPFTIFESEWNQFANQI